MMENETGLISCIHGCMPALYSLPKSTGWEDQRTFHKRRLDLLLHELGKTIKAMPPGDKARLKEVAENSKSLYSSDRDVVTAADLMIQLADEPQES